MSAPAFSAASAGIEITRPIMVEGNSLSLAKFTVQKKSALKQMSVAKIERDYDVSVVLLRRYDEKEADMHPTGIRVIQEKDILAIMGSPEQISHLVNDNQ